jgi:hypothetical protein
MYQGVSVFALISSVSVAKQLQRFLTLFLGYLGDGPSYMGKYDAAITHGHCNGTRSHG